jgi:multidrug efflux pump subunit AcrA (membrane-fusion protein)
VAGRLDRLCVRAGEVVEQGRELAVLSSPDLDLQITELEGQVARARARRESLMRERFENPDAAVELGTVEESLASFREQLEKKTRYRAELRLVAPRAGVVLPAPGVKPQPDGSGRLPTWSGDALDERNLGATFIEGTVLCMVGDPEKFEAVMVIDQSEVEFLARGQHVDLKLDAFPWRTFTGTVDEIAETHLEGGAERLSVKAGGQLPTETDPSGREQPISTSYEAMTTLDDRDAALTPGMRGTARIQVGSRTVGQWLLRLLWQTFNFRM